MAGTAAGGSTLYGVSDNVKRWVVFGIVLNKALIRTIRPFVEQHVQIEYGNLKASHGIDTQSATGRLQHWPNLPTRQILLKYENINGNDRLPRVGRRYNYSVFDCRVTSYVDFAKLYVENFMVTFNAFDEHCDASAVLNLLGKVPVFSAAVQSAASDVRQARNAWAHCAFSDWDPVKFQQCFNEMEQLVKALCLPAVDERDLLTDLKDWATKGTSLCMNATVDPDLLKLVHCHVNSLTKDVEMLAFEVEEDRDKVLKALTEFSTKLEELEKRLASVECEYEIIKKEQSSVSNKVDTLHANLETTQENFKSLVLKEEDDRENLKHLELKQADDRENLKRLQLKQEDDRENLKRLESKHEDVKQRVAHVEDQLREKQGASEVNAECHQDDRVMTESVKYLKSDLQDVQQRLTQVEAEKQSSAIPQISCEIADCEADVRFFADRYDPDTRQWLFEDFDKWFSDPGDSRAYVLLGDAGIGKSVMSGALAQRTRKVGHLGAAYFCRHYDNTRNDPRYLLGTVACQLCYCNVQYCNLVGGKGGVSMMLNNSKLRVHELFTKLLEEPLSNCDPCHQRKLVIIDALDETEHESREEFLELVKKRFPRLPKWLVFFITSRPEDTVQRRLERYNPCITICAGNSKEHSLYQQHEQDIQRFLENEVDFSRLPYSVEEVTKKCNGLFLYAFYIAKVLKDSVNSGKIDQLSQWSGFFPGDIEDFFYTNFKRVLEKVREDLYRKLFGCIITAPAPLPVSFISFVLNRENSDLDEQDVIDAVSLFVVLRVSDQTVNFLHNLIPAWITNKRKARKLFINKKTAGEYLGSIFVQILSDVVDEPVQTFQSVDADLQRFVLQVAVRCLCQNGDKGSLKVVFSCLTSYCFLEKRIRSARIEIYHLLEDLKLAASYFTGEEAQKNDILQEISLALETDVHVLLECPHLLRSCIRNASNLVQNSILVPQVSVPWMEWNICDISAVEFLSGCNCFATASDKKTVAAAKDLSLFFVDSSTLQTVSGPFEISQGTIKKISHLEFSADDKFVLFGRLDKWFSVERECVEDLPQFIENSFDYEWCLLTSDGQSIVVRNNCLFYFPQSCEMQFCITELLALWAMKEIDQSQDDQKTCSFGRLEGMIAGIRSMGDQMAHLLEFLQIEPTLYETHVTFVPDDPTCYYCGKLKELKNPNQESSLTTVRQLIIELYPRIFRHQVWHLQTGRPLLYDIFFLGAQFNSFTYFCHVTSAFEKWAIPMGCSGVDQALSVCNIAIVNAIGSLLKIETLKLQWELKRVWDWQLEWKRKCKLQRNREREVKLKLEREWDLERDLELERECERWWERDMLERVQEQKREMERKQKGMREWFLEGKLEEPKQENMWKQKRIGKEELEIEQELERVRERKQKVEQEWKRELEQVLERVREQKREMERKQEGVREWFLGWKLEEPKQENRWELEKIWELEREVWRVWELELKLMMVSQWKQVREWKLKLEQERQPKLKLELTFDRKLEQEWEKELRQVLERVWEWQWELEQKQKRVWEEPEQENWWKLENVWKLEQEVGSVWRSELELKLMLQTGSQWVPGRKREWKRKQECRQSCRWGIKPELERSERLDLDPFTVQELQQKLEQKCKLDPDLYVDLQLFCDSFKSGLFINFPRGFLDLVGTGISFCVSPKKKWVAVRNNIQKIHLLQTGIQDEEFCYDNSEKQEHSITHVVDFTFTTDDLYVVYLSDDKSLHALSLQTGTILTSVSGPNLFYFTEEKQTGYLFRSGTDERPIFLKNLYSRFKFFLGKLPMKLDLGKYIPLSDYRLFGSPFSASPSLKSMLGKSITTIFSSSNTVMSVSSDLNVTLWNTTNEKRGITFRFISNSSLTGSRTCDLHATKCVPSPDGKLIAIQQKTKIELYSIAQSERFHCILFEADFGFIDVSLTFSSDGTFLLFYVQDNFSEPHFCVWDVQKRAEKVSFKSPGLLAVECFCLSSNKRNLILCGEYEVQVWELDNVPGRVLNRIEVERTYKSVQFSQCAVSLDDELLVCCIANLIFLYNLRVDDVRSSKRVLRGHLGKIEFCKFLKVNRYLISYAVDGMVFLWDIIESKAAGFARIAQGQEKSASMAVAPEEDRVVCFTSSDRVCVIKLCNLECALSSKFLTVPAKGKVDTTAEARRLQLAGQIALTSEIPTSSVENESFSSSDSDEDMTYYYQEHEEFDESD